MKKIFILWLLLVIGDAQSVTLVHGVLEKNSGFFAYYLPATDKRIPFEFPRKSYNIRGVNLVKMEYDRSASLSQRSLGINENNHMWIEGKIDLISYDQDDHFFTFKLTMSPHILYQRFSTPTHQDEDIRVNGKAKIFNGDESCLIHGRYQPGDKPSLISVPYPGDCPFSIGSISKTQEIISFKITHEIPLLIELT